MEYEPVIGLEIHAQLKTASKIFCGCSTKFGGSPNTHTCPVCLGMPGSLPVLNREVVEFTRSGWPWPLTAPLQPIAQFSGKTTSTPTFPKGTRFHSTSFPLRENGWVEIESSSGPRRIRIHRIHMEEDAGKLMHDEHQPLSYVDFNRTGVPLIEIVSEPDLATPEEAAAYLKTLREILRYLEICDGNMEEGSMRCDANISLRPAGTNGLGTKVELKNMNSFKNVQKALEFEIRRQKVTLERGEPLVQETRLWDAGRNVTLSMRSKEESHDYRYFPDPDLVPVVVSQDWVQEVRSSLPELPEAKRERFIKDYALPPYDAKVLTSSKSLANYFEAALKRFAHPKALSNWIMSELLRELNRDNREIEELPGISGESGRAFGPARFRGDQRQNSQRSFRADVRKRQVRPAYRG